MIYPSAFTPSSLKTRHCVMLRAQNYVLNMVRGWYRRSSQRCSGVISIYAQYSGGSRFESQSWELVYRVVHLQTLSINERAYRWMVVNNGQERTWRKLVVWCKILSPVFVSTEWVQPWQILGHLVSPDKGSHQAYSEWKREALLFRPLCWSEDMASLASSFLKSATTISSLILYKALHSFWFDIWIGVFIYADNEQALTLWNTSNSFSYIVWLSNSLFYCDENLVRGLAGL